MRRLISGVAATLMASTVCLVAPGSAEALEPARSPEAEPTVRVVVPFDFDGDLRPEVVVGAPRLVVDGKKGAGGVWVYRSSSDGTASTPLVLTQATRGIPGAPQTGDAFGTAVASADFDGDGYADLAIGQPGEDTRKTADTGAVTIVYGSPTGLDLRRAVALHAPGRLRAKARLGSALAVGNFDGTGPADLAVGAPGDRVQRNPGHRFGASGSVRILRGSSRGLTTAGSMLRTGARKTGTDGFDMRFGSVLAAGDLSRDGIDDLVVGAAGRSFRGKVGYAGWISTCVGQLGKVAGCHRIRMPYAKQYARGWAGMTSMTVGVLTLRGGLEIVVGSPHYKDGDRGSIWVLSLTKAASTLRNINSYLPGNPAEIPRAKAADADRQHFGESVAIGYAQRGLTPLLSVGSPGFAGGRGVVTTINFALSYADPKFAVSYGQDLPEVPGSSRAGNAFGSALSYADPGLDGNPELAVGLPGLDHGTGGIAVLTYDPATRLSGGELLRPEPDRGRPIERAGFGQVLGRT